MSLKSTSRLRGQRVKHAGRDVGKIHIQNKVARFIFGNGMQILPKLEQHLSGYTSCRMLWEGGQHWFEFGIRINAVLDGNPVDGWSDPKGYFRLVPEYSTDLVNWEGGKFTPPTSDMITSHGDGRYTYWQRAVNPAASEIKSWAIYCESTVANGDTRNNPFTAVVIAGVTQALPRYPYTMPQDAAALQEDLIAAGWAGTTVTAGSDVVWAITVPTVNFTSLSQASSVRWPGYLVEDVFGNLTNTIDERAFEGNYVNAFGVPIYLKGFGRLRILPGPRYQITLAERLQNLREEFGL
jgi:hypothetical protein